MYNCACISSVHIPAHYSTRKTEAKACRLRRKGIFIYFLFTALLKYNSEGKFFTLITHIINFLCTIGNRATIERGCKSFAYIWRKVRVCVV
jgi:hypothetical protein